MIRFVGVLVSLGLCAVASFAWADGKQMTGRADAIAGKTLQMQGLQIVLWGIETPALDQTCSRDGEDYPCGKDSRRYLQDLTSGVDVRCDILVGGYLRVVGQCFIGDVDVALLMVAGGHAFDRVGPNGPYRTSQNEAKDQKKGIWAGRFERPEIWRYNNQ